MSIYFNGQQANARPRLTVSQYIGTQPRTVIPAKTLLQRIKQKFQKPWQPTYVAHRDVTSRQGGAK